MKIIFLLPPSEGKKTGGSFESEILSFPFEKPLKIIKNVTEKDLKCTGKRFEEAQKLNKNIENGPFLEAIQRYSGVMYNSIGYEKMSKKGQKYFENHFLIFSGMYGIVKPKDCIGNYKLPIEAKNLSGFWKEKITQTLKNLEVDIIVDFLPLSYKKMIDFSQIGKKVLEVNFIEKSSQNKIAHGVKKIKGEYIQYICEHQISHKKDLGKYEFDEGIIMIEEK
ncbi:MAG: peroxide stress protein YaaA [Candidatus Altimarinota bacterium]